MPVVLRGACAEPQEEVKERRWDWQQRYPGSNNFLKDSSNAGFGERCETSLFSRFNEQCGASDSHKIKDSFYPTEKNYFNIMSDNEMQRPFNRDSFYISQRKVATSYNIPTSSS